MFDIGFSELLLIFIIGLVVLGPQKLPLAIRTVVGWIRTLRNIASNVQNELAQEMKLQELQESIKKAEQLDVTKISPELAKTVEDLKASANKIQTELEQQTNQIKSSTHTSNLSVSPAEQAELAEDDENQLELEPPHNSQLDSQQAENTAENRAKEQQPDLSSYDPLADPTSTFSTQDLTDRQKTKG